jgi:hypothetical protein
MTVSLVATRALRLVPPFLESGRPGKSRAGFHGLLACVIDIGGIVPSAGVGARRWQVGYSKQNKMVASTPRISKA